MDRRLARNLCLQISLSKPLEASLSLTSGRRQAVSPPATTPSQMVKCSDSIMSWFALPGGLESFLLEQTYNLGRVRSPCSASCLSPFQCEICIFSRILPDSTLSFGQRKCYHITPIIASYQIRRYGAFDNLQNCKLTCTLHSFLTSLNIMSHLVHYTLIIQGSFLSPEL